MSAFVRSLFLVCFLLLDSNFVNGQCDLGDEVANLTACGNITAELIIQLVSLYEGSEGILSDGLSYSEEFGSSVANAIAGAVTVAEQGIMETIAAGIAEAAVVHTLAEDFGEEHTEAVVQAIAQSFSTKAGIAFADALANAALDVNCSAVVHVTGKALALAGEAIVDAVTKVEAACNVQRVADVIVKCSFAVQNCTNFIGSSCCVEEILNMPAEDTCLTLYTAYTYVGVCNSNENQVLLKPGFGDQCLCIA
eukprot:TRINITY_DN2351_c1_g1_i1.p1 TRINITY_DN2351_c1_g1~~TRINITY_DN2351_c1_g1_i1.p1  ORF type:complete len:251 (+),score=28.81 TRINITY_DN2351_c1_g1_i1:137-889(+)